MTTINKQCEWIEPYPLESTERCFSESSPWGCYCEAHMERAYQKGTAHRQRHKDIARAARIQDINSLFNDVVAELEDLGEIEL